MVSFEDDTALDFPSGREQIPRCSIEVVRGDKMHRGMNNPGSTPIHRCFIALDTANSVSFRKTAEGLEAFEPAPESEQRVLNKAFNSSRISPVKRRK